MTNNSLVYSLRINPITSTNNPTPIPPVTATSPVTATPPVTAAGVVTMTQGSPEESFGAPAIIAAHIHFGQPGVNGGIVAFLCGGKNAPSCPAPGKSITGTITAADIQAVPAQGVKAGDFQAFRQILESGLGYVNVHSQQFPAGEIRGQMQPSSSGMGTGTPAPTSTLSITGTSTPQATATP
jgi:hypothetical protein